MILMDIIKKFQKLNTKKHKKVYNIITQKDRNNEGC